jgi:hypothetical protein
MENGSRREPTQRSKQRSGQRKNRCQKRELTEKQRRFVREFAICLRGKESAARAGYPAASAAQVAHENLHKPHIVEAVNESIAALKKKSNVDRDTIIGELLMMAFARGRLLFRSFDRWSRLPRTVRQRGSGMDFETRPIEYMRHLRRLEAEWRKLSLEEKSSLAGRLHTEGAIAKLEFYDFQRQKQPHRT